MQYSYWVPLQCTYGTSLHILFSLLFLPLKRCFKFLPPPIITSHRAPSNWLTSFFLSYEHVNFENFWYVVSSSDFFTWNIRTLQIMNPWKNSSPEHHYYGQENNIIITRCFSTGGSQTSASLWRILCQKQYLTSLYTMVPDKKT